MHINHLLNILYHQIYTVGCNLSHTTFTCTVHVNCKFHFVGQIIYLMQHCAFFSTYNISPDIIIPVSSRHAVALATRIHPISFLLPAQDPLSTKQQNTAHCCYVKPCH